MAAINILDALANSSFFTEDSKVDVHITKRHGKPATVFADAEDRFLIRCCAMGFTPERARELAIVAYNRMAELIQHCESPLERMMLGPLLLANYDGFGTVPPQIFVPKGGDQPPVGDLVLMPQFPFVRYRLDLVVFGSCEERGTKFVALECDGADYHQNAEYERKKDALMESFGVTVVHATGKEIHADPLGVAERVSQVLVNWKAGQG